MICNEDSEVCFIFEEDTKPDMSTYLKRFKHYLELTHPKHMLDSDDKILKSKEILERVQKIEASKENNGE